MIIYLLRHGQAEQNSTAEVSKDALSCLTAKGIEDIGFVAEHYAASNHRVDRCLASPLKRAQQTAELFLAEADLKCALESEDVLRPESTAHNVLNFLETFTRQNILLIGHNPLLSVLHTLLTSGEINYSKKILAAGELCGLSFDHFGRDLGVEVLSIMPNIY